MHFKHSKSSGKCFRSHYIYDNVIPYDGESPWIRGNPSVGPESRVQTGQLPKSSSLAPYFGNSPTLGISPTGPPTDRYNYQH